MCYTRIRAGMQRAFEFRRAIGCTVAARIVLTTENGAFPAHAQPMSPDQAVIDLRRIDGVLFDLDGVVTETASVHAAAWKQTFDGYLRDRSTRSGDELTPFDIETDYKRYVDGRSRFDGAQAFLASRGISLPAGDPGDSAGGDTVSAIAARKDEGYRRRLAEDGVQPFASTVALLRDLRSRGVRTGLFSASRNCVQVLEAAGVRDLFDAKVDGLDAEALALPGKPDPAIISEVAARAGVDPGRAAVIEDAIAGVAAGRSGGFALVIGVDRAGRGDELRSAGADVVVGDLAELRIEPDPDVGREPEPPARSSAADEGRASGDG